MSRKSAGRLLREFAEEYAGAQVSLRGSKVIMQRALSDIDDCGIQAACEGRASQAVIDRLYGVADTLDEAAHVVGIYKPGGGEAGVLIGVMDDLCDLIRKLEDGEDEDLWDWACDDDA